MNHTLRYRTIFSPVAHLHNFASSWKDVYMAYNVSKWYLLFQNETSVNSTQAKLLRRVLKMTHLVLWFS